MQKVVILSKSIYSYKGEIMILKLHAKAKVRGSNQADLNMRELREKL